MSSRYYTHTYIVSRFAGPVRAIIRGVDAGEIFLLDGCAVHFCGFQGPGNGEGWGDLTANYARRFGDLWFTMDLKFVTIMVFFKKRPKWKFDLLSIELNAKLSRIDRNRPASCCNSVSFLFEK